VVEQIRALRPDFFFSFYYREMLKKDLLDIPQRGALNMHGSLLPKYRGRVPVNWAIIHGETETGATLHYMTEKPDNGDIVAQQAVPILPNDTAFEVFQKVTVAAEMALNGVLPALLAGKGQAVKQDFKEGKAYAICGQGVLRVLRFELDGVAMSAAEFAAKHGTGKFEFGA
jgi:methionyl-tRNA formyltransferase